jgi:hypothetical protein
VRRSIAKLDAPFYPVDLFQRNDGRGIFATDQANYIRQGQDFHAIDQIHVNEDVARKKRHLQRHAPVFPLTHRPKAGKEIFELAVCQALRGPFFLVDPDMQDKPRKRAGMKWQIALGQGEELFQRVDLTAVDTASPYLLQGDDST